MTDTHTGPILAIDVQYVDDTGYAAAVLFDTWTASTPLHVFTHVEHNVAEYQPGQFYKRELPPVLALLAASPTPPAVVVIDGFVNLDAAGRPGLGQHLFDALGGKVPIVGVAKNPFRLHGEEGEPDEQGGPGAITRGSSVRPLYVTSAGMSQTTAEELVIGMHGQHRLPTMLKLVDQEARKASKRSAT